VAKLEAVLRAYFRKTSQDEPSTTDQQDALTVEVSRGQSEIDVSSWLSGMLRALSGGQLANFPIFGLLTRGVPHHHI